MVDLWTVKSGLKVTTPNPARRSTRLFSADRDELQLRWASELMRISVKGPFLLRNRIFSAKWAWDNIRSLKFSQKPFCIDCLTLP